MSHNDRDLPKCRKSATKEREGSDLSLSGSQVSLVSRPRSVLGKASFRALSVTGPRVRRPMSAVPTMSCSEVHRDKRRPYSADSQLLLSSCQQKRNKLSTCFSLSADSMGLANHDIETDGDIEFSSSTLVSSQLSDQLEGAWMELEMRGLYMGHTGHTHASSSTDNDSDLLCCSDVSEEHSRSEKSLGERIQALARVHIHHGLAIDPESTSGIEKNGEGVEGQSSKYVNDEDPKKMSTKELHLQMVESGLISSLAYSSAYIHQGSNILDYGNQESHEPNSQPSLPNTVVSEKHFHQFSASTNGLKFPITTSKFWNQDNNVFQTEDQPNCAIDEISFPKEHDVDSVGGDSSVSLNGLESQLQAKGSLTSLPVHSGQENGNQFHWSDDDLAPVRFQQWVTDTGKSNCLPSVVDKESPFYHGVRVPHSQIDQNTEAPFNDCTVEEVSTDSEYSKTYPSPPDSRIEKRSSLSVNIAAPMTSIVESHSAKGSENSAQNKISEDGGKDFLPVRDKNILNSIPGDSTTSLLSQPSTHEKYTTSALLKTETLASDSNTSARSVVIETVTKAGNRVNSSFGPKENFLGSKISSMPRHSVLNEKKANGSESIRKNQDRYSQQVAKRRTESKVGASNRRIGRSSSPDSSLRNINKAKEEILPGEAQTELMSWMAMCSENLENRSTNVDVKMSNNQPLISTPPNNDDSPYDEIMTILRVLEEKEDESSLMRILNKKSQLQTSVENTECNASLALTAEDNKARPSSDALELDSDPCQIIPIPSISASGSCKSPDVDGVQKSGSPAKRCSSDIGVSEFPVQGELRDLLTFLDAVDQSCSSVLQPQSPPISRATSKPPLTPVNPHNLEELLLMGRSDLAQEIISLRLTLEDKDAAINLLRTALREQKDSQSRQNIANSKEFDNRVRQVKTECEAAVKRHQKFIDQLIAEKASLSQKCESMIQEAKEREEKHARAFVNSEEKHKIEMQRVKDITAATEKLKRERWVENKTQKIKELTVRGLEPELSRLTSQHEQEMSALRTLHAQELEQMEVRAARRASQQMETLREQLVQEKEDALTKERDMLRQRMEKQQLLFEEEGAEQRRRLVAEVRREQDRLATLEARLEAQFEERKRAQERESEQERERYRRDHADKLNEMHRKQQNEILQYREALKAEKEAWTETYQQQQKQTLIQTTNEIRDQLKRERDREIEIVIERLENEATISREEREKLAENRLKRVREQLTSELNDVESALNSLKEKHVELRSQLQEKEDKLVSCEALNRSLHTQLVETRKISDQLSVERADLKQILVAELNSEMECLRNQMAEQHTRHQQQLQILTEQAERERQTHQQELQQLFDRVKLAIAKKEEVVKMAKAKQKAAEEQTSHLQALLNHRRKESLLS